MKTLCIDIGNTSTHCGLASESKTTITHQSKCPTTEIATELPSILKTSKPTGIAFCSVVPQATEAISESLNDYGIPVFHLHHKQCPGLAINYPRPEEIGQDRLANAIAAQALYGLPSVVIDMGTAVTFDIVTERGYEGGIIAPGLEIMTRYLHEQTALLPALDPEDLLVPEGIGKSTVDAMKLGCAIGFNGMICALLDRVQLELKKEFALEPKIIGSGGSAGKLLKDAVPEIELVPDLVLVGLAEGFRRHFSN